MILHASSSAPRWLRAVLLAVVFATSALASACGASKGGALMVDSPLTPFSAPDEDELGDEDADDDDDAAAPAAAGEKE